MFKLDPNPTFVATVAGFKPGEGSGEGFPILFKYRGRPELVEFMGKTGDMTVLDALMDMMVGWKEIPLDFTRENVERVCDLYPAFVGAVFDCYRRELTEARRKN